MSQMNMRGRHSGRLLVAAWCFVSALLGLSAVPSRAEVPVVGWLWMGPPPPPGQPPFLREQLRRLGHEEGRTYVVEARYASGDNSKFPVLVRELLERRPAVIVTVCGAPLRAIRALNATVPVIAGCADPKNFLGEVKTLNRPGGRTTGFTFLAPESAAKRLQLLKELVPGVSRVAVLHDQEDWGTYWQEMERAAPQLRLSLARLPIARAEELDGVFAAAVRQGAEALVIMPTSAMFSERRQLATLAIQHKLPTIFDTRLFVQDGGLVSYGPDWGDDFAAGVNATYVDKILKGAAPGDLPVQQPTRLELVVNLKTARAIGVNVPRSFLIRADEVIQ
jgi:putative ABC transport system substrate-binding protein